MDALSAAESYLEYLSDKAEKGHVPITALDYSSLYPSLIMTYNLSPEYLITDPEHYEQVSQEYVMHEINFVYNFEDSEGNASSKNIIGWTVRHDSIIESESNKKRGSFGLYPEILQDLFNQRTEMKKGLTTYKEKKEHMEKHVDNYADTPEYQDCLFNLDYCDTKQKALKVYMNCFYGELGNKNSPLFILELAGGITSAGQDNLRKVKSFIEEKKCRVYYGDTDSMYFAFESRLFNETVKQFLLSHITKEEYCERLVMQTFDLVKDMAKQVNKFLMKDNGTKFLKMAYEEVLYPANFIRRKKYYGLAHEGLANFNDRPLFVRGLEVKKRGVSEILKTVCTDIMKDSMSIYNSLTVLQLVLNKIDFLYTNKWNMDDFLQNAVHRPDKQNISVNTFVKKLTDSNRTPPTPYERFNYVIVKITDHSKLYDFKGRKIDIKKGDRMELYEHAMKNGMEIDLDYYFEKQLIGQFAGLICYDSQFQISESDEKVTSECKRFIKNYASKWTSVNTDIRDSAKQAYRQATEYVKSYKQSCPRHARVLFISEMNTPEELAKTLIDKNAIMKEAELLVKELKSKVNLTKMYNKRRNSYASQLTRKAEESIKVNSAEFINFCNKSEIGQLLFDEESLLKKLVTKDSKINISEDMIKEAYSKLTLIAADIKTCMLTEYICDYNVKNVTRRKGEFIRGFKL